MNSNGESDCVVQLCEAMQIGKTRILVVDDNQTVRLLLCEALRSHLDFEIVCESADAAAGISKAAELQPDVVILDISLPDMNGIEGVRRMRSIAPSAEILLCSQHDHIGMAMEGLKAGALGYLLKSDAIAEVAAAVRKISKGEQYLSHSLTANL